VALIVVYSALRGQGGRSGAQPSSCNPSLRTSWAAIHRRLRRSGPVSFPAPTTSVNFSRARMA